MGRPKQLLRLGEKTLLERVLANVRAANVAEIVLVLGFAAEQIQQQVSTDGLRVVLNEGYRQGMGSSLRKGLSSVNPRAQGALVVLADEPFVRPATLNAMIEYHASHKPQIIIPMFRGFRGNPILLDRSVFQELMNLQGDIGCRAIFGGHTENIHKLPVNDPGILLDLDTAAELKRMQELAEGSATLSPDVEIEQAARGAGSAAIRPELAVVGKDDLARALVRFAHWLGFTTTLVDPFLTLPEVGDADRVLHRLDFSLLDENANRYVVIASKGQFDEEGLEEALRSNARYIALVAGKGRREELIQVLKKKGYGKEALDRLRSSAGLEIGAETPEEIALSVMAQIVQERRKTTGHHGNDAK